MNQDALAQTFWELPERSTLGLGDGLDVHSMESYKQCVAGEVKKLPQRNSEYFVDSALTLKELVPHLFQTGRFQQGSAQSSLLDRLYTSEYQAKRRSLYYLVKLTHSEWRIEEARFSDSANDPSRCGDFWIDRIITGAYVLLSVHLDFSSEQDATQVLAQADLKTLSMTKLGNFLQNLAIDSADSLQLSFELDQIGGNTQDVFQIFGAPKTAVSCRYPNITSCINILQRARQYMVDPQKLFAQLSTAQDSSLRYFHIRPYRANDLQAQWLFAIRDELFRLERSYQAALYALTERQRRENTPEYLQQLDIQSRLIQDQLSQLRNARQLCFQKKGTCEEINLTIPERSLIIAQDSFLEICQSRFKSASQHIIFDELQANTGYKNCRDIHQALITQNELSLSDLGIKELSFLRGLEHLEVLDLSGNALESLNSMPLLPRVFVLDLSSNHLRSLEGLERAPFLQKLNLDHNKLSQLNTAHPLPYLLGLRALGNPISNFHQEYQDLSKLRALYLDSSDICAAYRSWVVTRKLVSAAEMNAYAAVEFAPVFYDKHRKQSIKYWAHCAAVVSEYTEAYPALDLPLSP